MVSVWLDPSTLLQNGDTYFPLNTFLFNINVIHSVMCVFQNNIIYFFKILIDNDVIFSIKIRNEIIFFQWVWCIVAGPWIETFVSWNSYGDTFISYFLCNDTCATKMAHIFHVMTRKNGSYFPSRQFNQHNADKLPHNAYAPLPLYVFSQPVHFLLYEKITPYI